MTRDRPLVLVVDDDLDLRLGICRFLRAVGYDAAEAEDGAGLLRAIESGHPDMVILDVNLPDGSGIDFLDRVRQKSASTPVVILTADASINRAVEAIKHGAENFLTKPVDSAALQIVIERALLHRAHRLKALSAASSRGGLDPFIGRSEAVSSLRQDTIRLLATDRPILLLGETGSGKGVLARWIHAKSPRAQETFVDLNCAGLSREILESELFGHEAGAFTGATRRKIGLLEEAHRGTVFLDELAETDLNVQARLLKALEDKRIRRLGSTKEIAVDFRLIAATHQDLKAMSLDGRFREDLFFRLSAFPLRVPALRERTEDLPEIAAFMLAAFAAEIGRPALRFSVEAIEAMKKRAWRGNLRELKNAVERAALFAEGDLVGDAFLRTDEARATAPDSADSPLLTLEEVERHHIERVMRAEKNRVQAAARRLGIARSSLYEKLRRFGLDATDPAGEPQ
jgi:DNA-binding NtrC family response regulator